MSVSSVLSEHPEWVPLFIFFARVTDVSIGTVRLICVTRGRRLAAIALGFFEVLIWILAVSRVLTDLDRGLNILAYAGGFATGNALGMWIEQKIAMGMQMVTFLSRGRAHAVAERLRFANFVVTSLEGSGRDGPVALCMAIVPRRRTFELIEMAREVDPEVHATVEDIRHSTAALPRGTLEGRMTPAT